LAPFERNAVDTSLRQFPQNQVEAVIAVCYNRFIKSGYEKRFLPTVIFGWEALPRMSIWGLCHISKYAEALTRQEFLLPELLFFSVYGIIKKMPEA
jgi:hypothetical protein